MKYIFVVEWDKDYVRSCAQRGISCVNDVINHVRVKYRGKMILAQHEDYYCQWVALTLTEDEMHSAYEEVRDFLVEEYDLLDTPGVLNVHYNEHGSDVIVGGPVPDEADVVRPKSALARRISSLTDGILAVSEFKSLIDEIAKMTSSVSPDVAEEIYSHRHYVFSVDKGYDIERYMQILADALHAAGLFPQGKPKVKLDRLEKADERRGNSPIDRVISDIDDYSRTFVALDINEWMDSVRSEDFRKLLYAIEKQADCVMVFVIPYVEKSVLNRVAEGISDVLNVRTVSFVPYSKEELQICAARYLKTFGAELTEDAWRTFHAMILQEKSDGNFYGESTVRKICRDILSAKALYNADNGQSGFAIDAASLQAIAPQEIKELSVQDMLDGMIGLESVRKKLFEIVEQIDAGKQFDDVDMPSIHMRFVGNPGTGKTTVARIVGRMLKERGLLRIGDLYEVHGRDLVGRYIGETAPKTASICRDAYGSVLFIDEAYTLYRSTDNDKDFGREALDTLIAQMENHRQDLVVIMAGYTDDIAKMMKANSGLENRMPYLVEFPNYTRDELYRIFRLMTCRYGKYEEDVLQAAKAFFDSLPDSLIEDKSFGNGRYVRNLFERTRAKAITRRQLEGAAEIVLKKADFELAVTDNEFKIAPTADKRRIGFN